MGSGQSFSVLEFAADGVALGTATATDVDTVGLIQNWAITSGNADGVFEIDAASGEIRVLDNTLLNFETTASYVLGLTVQDGVNTSATQTVSISIVDENDIPVLVTNLGTSVVEGSSVTISSAELAVTDEDELPSQILFSVVSPPAAGRLELTGNPGVSISSFTQDDIDAGRLRYVHDGSEADDGFTFSVSDGSGGTIATAAFSITNLRVNDAPVNAVPSSQTVNEDSPLVFSSATGNLISVSDVDLNGGSIGVRLVSTNGTMTLGATAGLAFVSGDGTADSDMVFAGSINAVNAALDGLRFDPSPDYNGPATIRIVSQDMGNSGSGGQQTDDDTINITVSAVNDNPVANDDTYAADEDHALTVSAASGLLSNDFDIDSSLSVLAVTGPANGALSLNADGSFVYTPNANFNGVDAFTYRATDGSLQSETRTVTLNVAAVNDAAVSIDDDFVVDQLSVLNLSAANGVLVNDLDVEADLLQAVLVDGPQNGRLVLNADGSLTYTPNATFFGEDVFTYQTLDGTDDGSVATVRITVRQTVTSTSNDSDGDASGDGDGSSTGDGNSDQTGERGTDKTPAVDGTTEEGTGNGSNNLALNDLLTSPPTDTSTTDSESSADETRETSSGADGNQNDGSHLDGSSFVVAMRIDDRGELRDRLAGRFLEDAEVVLFTSTDVGSMVYALEQAGFWTELDTFEQDVKNSILEEGEWEELVVETTTVAGTTLTVGYIVWLLRSGSVVFGLVSSLPAWTMMDPLPILQSGLASLGDTDDADDDSLQGILQAHHDGMEIPDESFES